MPRSSNRASTVASEPAPPAPGNPPTPGDLSPAVAMWHAFLLRKATQRVTAMSEEALSPYGLSMQHFGVLSSAEADPGLNQRVVGERLRINRTTLVALCDDLEEAGLLERRRGVDRRSFLLYLTDDGKVRLGELKKLTAEVHAAFLAPLSPAEQAMLHDLLFKLASG